jgi:hypothetical protein
MAASRAVHERDLFGSFKLIGVDWRFGGSPRLCGSSWRVWFRQECQLTLTLPAAAGVAGCRLEVSGSWEPAWDCGLDVGWSR